MGIDNRAHDEKLHQLHHDIQNCLSVISMATEILKNVRDNDQKFKQVCETIENERRKAVELLDEILKRHCDECESMRS